MENTTILIAGKSVSRLDGLCRQLLIVDNHLMRCRVFLESSKLGSRKKAALREEEADLVARRAVKAAEIKNFIRATTIN